MVDVNDPYMEPTPADDRFAELRAQREAAVLERQLREVARGIALNRVPHRRFWIVLSTPTNR